MEDCVEGFSQLAAKLIHLLCQTTDPKVHIIDARLLVGIRTRTPQEIQSIRRGNLTIQRCVEHDGHRSATLGLNACSLCDSGVCAIGSDEIHHRHRILQMLEETMGISLIWINRPAGVGLELNSPSHRIELSPGLIQ